MQPYSELVLIDPETVQEALGFRAEVDYIHTYIYIYGWLSNLGSLFGYPK